MNLITDDSFHQLIRVLESFLSVSFKFKTALRAVLYETTYNKGARILNFGQTQDIVWFLLDGLAREIKVEQQTFAEKTSWFWFPLSFLYADPGFFSREPSVTTIQVLDLTKVAFISYKDWKMLKDHYEEAEVLTEKIRGYNTKAHLEHADEIKNLDTDERYLRNEELLLSLFGKTKLKYIAEFMGMAPDTLGKLRKKYRKRK